MNNFGEHECVYWRYFTWLQHHCAPRCQGKSNFGRNLVKRVVPWSDASDNADGLTHDKRAANLFFKFKRLGKYGCLFE